MARKSEKPGHRAAQYGIELLATQMLHVANACSAALVQHLERIIASVKQPIGAHGLTEIIEGRQMTLVGKRPGVKAGIDFGT